MRYVPLARWSWCCGVSQAPTATALTNPTMPTERQALLLDDVEGWRVHRCGIEGGHGAVHEPQL